MSGPESLVTGEGGPSDSQETSAMPAMSTEATTTTSACRYTCSDETRVCTYVKGMARENQRI